MVHNLDLIGSVKPNNVLTMMAAGVKEMGLTKYLIQQVMLSHEKRMEELREFIPNAKSEDWDIVVAGQRVQVIKDTETGVKEHFNLVQKWLQLKMAQSQRCLVLLQVLLLLFTSCLKYLKDASQSI